MTFLSHLLSTPLAERIGWTLLHSLWQFALLAILVAGMLELLRRQSANLRYLVGCFALAAMFAGSVTTFCLLSAESLPTAAQQPIVAPADSTMASIPISTTEIIPRNELAENGQFSPPKAEANTLSTPTAPDDATETASAPLLSTIGEALSPWLPRITILWIGGVILLSLRNLMGWIGVQRLRRVGTAPVRQELADRARALVARMKISRPVRVLQSTLVEIPVVAGWLKPVILLPVSLLGCLSPAQLEAILAHELAHIQRQDYLVNLLQTVAETLLFYHPAVWWLSRRIRIEREHCCDDAAVRICGNNLGLGEALTLLEASRLTLQPVLAIAGNRCGGTLHRVRRLLDPKTESIGFSKASAAVVVLAFLGVAMTADWGRLATAENSPEKPREAAVSPEKGSAKDTSSQRHIEGRVADTSGRPIAGALLEWGFIREKPEKWQRTMTDAQGHYRLDLREFGVDYRLGVSAAGMAPQWKVFHNSWNYTKEHLFDAEATPPENADFRLQLAHRIRGIVVDEQGRPISGVVITPQTAIEGACSSFCMPSPSMPLPGEKEIAATTGPDGRFVVEGLPAEQVQLSLKSPHRYVSDENYVVDHQHRIVMSGSGRPGIARGRVIDQQTGKPVREFQVVLRYDPKPHPFTTTDGRFKLDGDFTEGGSQTVYVYSKNYAPAKADIRVLPPGSDDQPTIVLLPGRPLLGQLVDVQSGKPLAYVPVMYAVTDKDTKTSRYIEWHDWKNYVDGNGPFGTVQRATTDANGTFWFSGSTDEPEGTLFVFTAGYERLILPPEQLPAKDDAGRMRINVQPEAAISGVLLKGGQPAANEGVSVWKTEPKTDIEETFERVSTDSRGRFRIGMLAPGTYQIHNWYSPSRSVNTCKQVGVVTLGPGEQKTLQPAAIDDVASAPKPTQRRDPSEGLITRGREALDRIARQKPVWGKVVTGRQEGKEVKGLQVGISRLVEKATFQVGQRVPLEFYIRNTSDQTLSVLFPLEFYIAGRSATVYDGKGYIVRVKCAEIWGRTHFFRETLSPGAVLVCRHVGLGVSGEMPCIDPTVGHYSLEQRETICLMGLNDNTLWDTLALTTGRIDFTVVDKTDETSTAEKKTENAWGKPVEGVQCRLRPEKSTWKVGETPQIVADLRNRGQHKATMGIAPENWEVQYDGVWYQTTVDSAKEVERLGLKPGGQRDGILLLLENGCEWRSKEGNRPLEFKPGKHILLALFHLKTENAGELQIKSNPVEIEIVEKDAATATKKSADVSAAQKEHRYADEATPVPMKLDGSLRGRVLDHEGKPVEGARVFFRGPGSLTIENGRAKNNGVGSNAVATDASGRFLITGGGKETTRIVVLAPHLDAWIVPAPQEASKEELTIRLPRPATLKIVVDLPSAMQGNEQQIVEQPGKGPRVAPAGKDVSFRLEMKTWEMPGWKNSAGFIQTRTATNPGEVVFENLTPGSYDFSRTKTLFLGNRGQVAMCDRQQDVKLLPGESNTIRLVRKRGQRVGGEIHGLLKGVPGAFITVHPAEYTGDLRKRDEWKLPAYDCLTCQNDAKFLTGLLEPGRYKIVAEAHRPEPRTDVTDLGWHLPEFVGTALVTVEDDDPANPKKPTPCVTIEMKPRDEKAVGKDRGKAKLNFLTDLPEFRELDLNVTEEALQRMIAEKGLRNIVTENGQMKTYHVYRKDGENVIVIFRDGKCAGVQRMRTDTSYADKRFTELGKAARSLQVTLRAEKDLWHAGEDLALKADVRNTGNEGVAIYVDGNNDWQIEIDGQWYRSLMGTTAVIAPTIRPGERIEDISVPPTWTRPLRWFAFSEDDPWYQHHSRGKRLALEPGWHTVRVAVQAPFGSPVRAVSNAIKIKVQPATVAPGRTAIAEKIDPAEVRRKIAALALPDETAPYNEQTPNWLAARRDRILPELVAGLNDTNPKIAEGCLQVLKYASPSKELTDALVAKAGDQTNPLHYEILCQLEKSAADPRVARLLDIASMTYWEPLARARWAWLSGHKERAAAILKPVFEKIDSSLHQQEGEAIRLLSEIGGADAVTLLEPVASGDDWIMAVEAYKALAKIDPDKHGLTRDQAKFLDEQRGFKETVEQYDQRMADLAKLNRKEIRPFVMQMLGDTTNAGPGMALSILAAWRDKESLPQIRKFMQDKPLYYRQEAVTAYLSIDDRPENETGVLDMLSGYESIDNEYILRGIVMAEIPIDRKVAMLRAAAGKVSSPRIVPQAVAIWKRQDHDIRELLVPLMEGETNVRALAGYCELAAQDKQKRFGPQVRRAMTIVSGDSRIAAGDTPVSQDVAVAVASILQAAAAYGLEDAAPEIQKLAVSKNVVIKAAAQAAGAKLGLSGIVRVVIAQLSDRNPAVRQWAANSLLGIRPGDEIERAACEEALLGHLGKPSEAYAMHALVNFGGPKAVKALEPLLDDRNAQRGVCAAWVLAQLSDKTAAQKALRRVAIFGLFHHQSYQAGEGIDFQIGPGLSFHQVTMRLNPGTYSGEGPVRIPNNLLRPFMWDNAEQQFAVRCYRLAESGENTIGNGLDVHFLHVGLMGIRPTMRLDATQLPLLKEIAANDSHIKRVMVKGQPTAHFAYRQLAAKAIAAITKEKATYRGLVGETLDSQAFPEPYKNQNQLLAKFIVNRIEKAKLPRTSQTTLEWDYVSFVRTMIDRFREQFDPPPATQLLEAVRGEAKQRKVSLNDILPPPVR